MTTIYTIGHSTRTFPEFAALLQESGANMLVDVRTYPGSRRCPQFNKEAMPAELEPYQIGYIHMSALGGRRRSCLDHSPNGWWTHPSFRSYADYAMHEEFAAGLRDLLTLAETRICAIMCSEAVWWKCHRRIITDYLIVAGCDVRHIMGPGHVEPAKLTPAATVTGNHLTYGAAA